jgi:glyoxylase-like metal-dependent hydrolase (beta-lactamase superfamily II)
MFIHNVSVGPLQANCYLIGADHQSECVVVDPGMGALPAVTALADRYGLTPVALLASHGHFDHVADAHPLADHYDIPVWIHSQDRHLLGDPAAGVSADFAGWLAVALPSGLTVPAVVDTVDDQASLTLAGLQIGVIAAPGHTRGSVLYQVSDDTGDVVCTGDVLFAGSIGRTDMPGGDATTMAATLREVVLRLPDAARILPGHGPATTMARERRTNPYLAPEYLG